MSWENWAVAIGLGALLIMCEENEAAEESVSKRGSGVALPFGSEDLPSW